MNKNIIFKSIVSASIIATSVSCTKEIPVSPPGGSQGTTVTARLAGYEGLANGIEGEENLTDIKAFLFKDGTMSRIYDLEVSPSNDYTIDIDSRSGNLYVIAYTGGDINTEALVPMSMEEEQWKQSVTTLSDSPKLFYTGSINLESVSAPANNASVSLKRGLARFDMLIKTIDATTVSSVTIRNVAQNVHVFSDGTVISPADPKRKDITVPFDIPLSLDTAGIFYVGEQTNDNIEISVTANIGGTEKTMSKVISGDIKRNTVYTITVLQEKIDISLDVTFEDWEDGENTDVTPYGK